MQGSFNTVPLHSDSRGTEGMRVVILHGMLGSARNWRTVTAALAKTCRVSALDLRNHGESPHTGPFTVGDLSRDVEAWIENNVADGPVALLGHSLGGKTALKLACRRPDMVRKLIAEQPEDAAGC